MKIASNQVVLVCPMLKPITPFPTRVTLWITRWFILLGQGCKTCNGKTVRGPWLPQKGITHCSVYRSYGEILRYRLPGIIAASPSYRFLHEIVKSSNSFRYGRRGIPLSILQTHMLVLTAGNDSYVDSKVTREMIGKIEKEKDKEKQKKMQKVFLL